MEMEMEQEQEQEPWAKRKRISLMQEKAPEIHGVEFEKGV